MNNIATAFVKAQQEMIAPKKTSLNPFFKNKYAGLNEVLDAVVSVLNSNGIAVLQPMVHLDGKNFVKTVLLHDTGEMLVSFTEIIYNKSNDAQSQGSGISYARRYGLQSFVSIGSDDDDGQRASQPAPAIDIPRLEIRLNACGDITALGTVYNSFTTAEKTATETLKNELKIKLTPKN